MGVSAFGMWSRGNSFQPFWWRRDMSPTRRSKALQQDNVMNEMHRDFQYRREFLKTVGGAIGAASLAPFASNVFGADVAHDTANWSQPAGPNGTWSVNAADAPIHWSGARNEGIIWRTTLPEE